MAHFDADAARPEIAKSRKPSSVVALHRGIENAGEPNIEIARDAGNPSMQASIMGVLAKPADVIMAESRKDLHTVTIAKEHVEAWLQCGEIWQRQLVVGDDADYWHRAQVHAAWQWFLFWVKEQNEVWREASRQRCGELLPSAA